MHRPITQTMAAYLKALLTRTVPATDEQTALVLVQRGHVVNGAVTQRGRETLGMFCRERVELNPSRVASCVYWNSFYGWKGFITYADTPDQRTLIEFGFRLPTYHHNYEKLAQRAVRHELTKVRNLSFDCAPQMIEEPIDDYDDEEQKA